MAGTFSACSFRILGTAATPQNLFTIENIDATKLVTVRAVILQMDATAVLTSVMPLNKISRTAAVPTCGTVIAKAQGDASRFLAVYKEYVNAKDVTRERIYLETMQEVLAGMDKLIVGKEQGILPYLPLPELKKNATKPAEVQ